MSDLLNVMKKTLQETKLYIKLTNKGILVYGGWSEEKLLKLLKDKLMRQEIKSLLVCNNVRCDASFDKLLNSIIHRGIYNECILRELEQKEMPSHIIIKAMKYGLLGLNSDELKYFQNFGAEIYVIRDANMWTTKLDEKLIWNLLVTGLLENQCWNVIMCGLVFQNESILCRLLSSGIDVPGILSWPGQIKPVTLTIIQFLKMLGIDEDTLRYVEENGIDDEVENMLIDLGYNEYKEKKALGIIQGILCECNLTLLESLSSASLSQTETSGSCSLNKAASSSVFTSASAQYNVHAPSCACHVNLCPKEQDEILERNNYLRQNVMIPLSWAISRALKYQPSNPIHYIAHQLLRWKYNNVPEEEIYNAQQFVISATIAMDQRFIERRKREEEEAIRRLNEDALKNIDCAVCLERQKLYRIKKRCWKCTKVPLSA